MKAPFPYFGGKSRVAPMVWQRFGDVRNYIEPFFGSGAVLLSAPWPAQRIETVNDKDALLANFWRALQHDPEGVAYWADWPVSEVDLHSRHLHLINNRERVEAMMADPDAYDVKLAGWWVWGISQWIGSGWCSPGYSRKSGRTVDGGVNKKRPQLGGGERGVHARHVAEKIPHLGDAGRGVHRAQLNTPRQIPELGRDGRGVLSGSISRQLPQLRGDSGASGAGIHASAFDRRTGGIYAYMEALGERLRRVRVCCGDWTRVLGDSVTWRHGRTAIFLDPPYSHAVRDSELYAEEHDVAADVRQWAIENGDNPLLRIALCGYDTEHGSLMPESWMAVKWKASGGYGSQGSGRARENAGRETIWFSPHCLPAQQRTLFDFEEAA